MLIVREFIVEAPFLLTVERDLQEVSRYVFNFAHHRAVSMHHHHRVLRLAVLG